MAFTLTGAQVLTERDIGPLGRVGIIRRPDGVPAEDWFGHEVIALRRLEAGQGESAAAIEALRAEAAALVGFEHPNVLRVLGPLTHKNEAYVAIEWADGTDLGLMVARREVHLNVVVETARAIVAGLSALAGVGFHPRDLCASSIVVTANGPRIVPLACPLEVRVEHRVSPSGAFRGSPAYAAPERHASAGEFHDEKTTIFSFGVLFFEMMTFQTPFRGGTPTRMLADIAESAPRLPESIVKEIPGELSKVCLRCLEKDPERRFANLGAVDASLRIVSELAAMNVRQRTSAPAATSAAVKQTTTGLPVSRRAKRLRGLGIVVLLAVVAAAGLGLALMSSDGGGAPQAPALPHAGTQTLMQADDHIVAGRHDEAIRLLDAHRAHRDVDPARFDHLYRRANSMYWLGRADAAQSAGAWDEAVKALEEAMPFQDPERLGPLRVQRDVVRHRALRDRADECALKLDWQGVIGALEEAAPLGEKIDLPPDRVAALAQLLSLARAMLEAQRRKDLDDSAGEIASLFVAERAMPGHRAPLLRLAELECGPDAAETLLRAARQELRDGKLDEAAAKARDARAKWPFGEGAAHVEAYVADRRSCDGSTMAYVSATYPGEGWSAAERAQNYCIDRYEYPGAVGELPRRLVSAVEAASLCGARGSRLCSLAEWQLACAGPDNLEYPYGSRFVLNACRTNAVGPAPVGGLASCASVFGVFDMSGNVAEWTSDEIPAGLMVAGGDWAGGASATRCSSASPFAAGLTSVRVGFRCCRSPTPPEQPAEPAPE